MKRGIALVVGLFGVMVAGLIVWLVGSSDSSGVGRERPPLRIALGQWAGYAHAFVAQEKGLFAKHGVEVQLTLNQEHSSEFLNLYRRGQVDGLFLVLSDAVMLWSTGSPTRVVYIADYSQSGDVIVGRPELASLADLKNRTVAFEEVNSFSHIFVLQALERYGIDESQVLMKVSPSDQVVADLDQGLIDAGHTWQPATSQALAKGYKVLASARDVPGLIVDVLAFDPEIVATRPDDVRAVVRALLEASDFVAAHRAEAVTLMAKAMGMSEAEMASGLDEIWQPGLQGNREALAQSDSPFSLYNAACAMVRFFLERGQLRAIPDVNRMIDHSAVESLAEIQRP
ncbi:MAG: ABC transporter substrate-binding protein [Magnetococcales bacterium]|nr:ABC transporter substrate-binding protein [Magnetococcales bacterium]